MKFITHKGIKIPALGYGTWQLSGREAVKGVETALKTGYRHIDTAYIYENEDEVGTALKSTGIARSDIFLTTKVFLEDLHRDGIVKSAERSLKKLKTDYVDLLLIHWPVFNNADMKEQLDAFARVKAEGKARLIGVSNFTVAQMKEGVETHKADIANNQVEYHPYLSQKPVLDYTRSHNMFVTAYSPLARGKVQKDKLLNDIGKKYGKTPGQVTLRWLVQQDNVAAIPKAASEKNLKANFKIFDFELTEDEMAQIHKLARPDGRLVNPDWSPAWDKAA